MLTKESLETRLSDLRKQQQEANTRAVLLEGAAQLCAQLLLDLAKDTTQDTPHD